MGWITATDRRGCLPAHPERGRQALPAGLFSDCGGALGTTETRNVLFLAAAAGERQAAAVAANVLDRSFEAAGSQPQMDR